VSKLQVQNSTLEGVLLKKFLQENGGPPAEGRKAKRKMSDDEEEETGGKAKVRDRLDTPPVSRTDVSGVMIHHDTYLPCIICRVHISRLCLV
jgi:hypothetical protein